MPSPVWKQQIQWLHNRMFIIFRGLSIKKMPPIKAALCCIRWLIGYDKIFYAKAIPAIFRGIVGDPAFVIGIANRWHP